MRIPAVASLACMMTLVGGIGETAPLHRDMKSQPSLTVTINPPSTSYCLTPDKSLVDATFHLHIQIHNPGKGAVILCRKYVEISAPTLFYRRADGRTGDVAYSFIPDTFGIFDRKYPRNLKRDYLVVQAQSSVDAERETGVFLALLSGPKPRGIPASGTYFLQVALETWSGPPDAPAALRERWKAIGDLFDGQLDSNLVTATLEIPEKLAECKY